MRVAMAVFAAALLAFSLTACGGDDEPETTADTTAVGAGTSAPSDTSPPDPEADDPPVVEPASEVEVDPAAEEEQVLAAVQCYWDTLVAANSPPDPDHPGFERCFTGRALETSRANALERSLSGQIVGDPDGIAIKHIEVLRIDGETAAVRACILDDAVLMARDSGLILNDAVSTQISEVTLALGPDGLWRVEHTLLAAKVAGDQPCP